MLKWRGNNSKASMNLRKLKRRTLHHQWIRLKMEEHVESYRRDGEAWFAKKYEQAKARVAERLNALKIVIYSPLSIRHAVAAWSGTCALPNPLRR